LDHEDEDDGSPRLGKQFVMNHLECILVCVDFSDGSKAALQQAVRIARRSRARLHVLHVIEALAVTELAEALKVPLRQERETALEHARAEMARWLGDLDTEKFQVDAVIGTPLDQILKRARAVGAELVVLGTRGANASARGAGTLATQVLRKAPCKVLLVAGGQTKPFRTIVAGIDFSATAREVADQARHVATQDGSAVHFLHVFFGPWRRLHYRRATPEANPDFELQYRGMLQRQLNEFVGDVQGFDARCVLHDASSYGQGIADYAGQVGADLIILGNKGQTNLRYVLLGSTAERLLRELPCSVLTVRAA
jgi:nucleotide-binding universal stress UspA family protein